MYYQEGFYRCRVIDQGFQNTKETNKPMIVLKVQPLARSRHDTDGTEYEEPLTGTNYDRSIYLVIDADDEEKMDKLLSKLRHAGFTGDSFADLDLVGKEVSCACFAQRSDPNKEDWKLCGPRVQRDSKPLEQMDSKAARTLDALFGRKLKTGAAPKSSANGRPEVVPSKPTHAASYDAQRPAAASVHRSTSNTDDSEIPF